MTINPQKLLPPSKLSTPAGRMSVPYDNKVDDVTNLNVKRKLINVDKFLKNSYTQKKKEEDKKKRKKQSETRQEKETKLETPKGIKGIGKIKSLIPATGILDAVQRFATFTFIGWLFTKFAKDLPKLLTLTNKLVPIANTVEKIIGGIFEGVVGFIDTGYKVYDQMRSLSKDIGGEKAQKIYDDFSKNFNYITNAILTLGLSTLVQPKPTPTKSNGGLVTRYASGGETTRGGKVVGGAIGRTLQAQSQKPKQQQKLKPQPTQPGKDVGGKKQIEKLYPNPKITDTKKPNAYKALTEASKSLKQGGTAGILMAAGVDLALGQNLDFNLMNSLSGDFLAKSKVNEVLQNIRKEISKSGIRGTGAAGSAGGGAGGVNTGAENFVPPNEIYDYLKSKGLSQNHIMGILANIQAESSFDSGVIGDNGTSGGLFQHHDTRFSGMVSYAGKDWDKNWKRQVDYALREGAGKQYLNKQFKTAADASEWFTLNFEIPDDKEQKAKDRIGNLKNYGADGSWLGAKNAKIIKGGPIKGGAVITQTGDPDAEQTGSDISIGKGLVGNSIQNPFDNLKITGKGFQGSGSGESGSGYGNYVTGEVVIGGKKYEVLLGHLNAVSVKRGDILSTGDIIGTQGISGHATGPHVTTHINALNGGDPSQILKSVEDVWVKGGSIETDNKPKPKPTAKLEPKPTAKPKGNWWDNLNPFKTQPKSSTPKRNQPSSRKVPTSFKVENNGFTDTYTNSNGRYTQNGKPITKEIFDAVAKNQRNGMQGGGLIGSQNRRNYSSLSMYPSYDSGGGMMIAVQPIIVEKPIPVPTGGNKTIMFPVPVSVNNSNMASLNRG